MPVSTLLNAAGTVLLSQHSVVQGLQARPEAKRALGGDMLALDQTR